MKQDRHTIKEYQFSDDKHYGPNSRRFIIFNQLII